MADDGRGKVQSSSLSHRNLLLDIPTVGISVDIKARRHSIACDQQCVIADERYDVVLAVACADV